MLIPAICFQGNCNEAISFYKETLEAEIKSIAFIKDASDDFKKEAALPDDFVADSDIVVDGQIIMMTDGGENRPTMEYFSFCFTNKNKGIY